MDQSNTVRTASGVITLIMPLFLLLIVHIGLSPSVCYIYSDSDRLHCLLNVSLKSLHCIENCADTMDGYCVGLLTGPHNWCCTFRWGWGAFRSCPSSTATADSKQSTDEHTAAGSLSV